MADFLSDAWFDEMAAAAEGAAPPAELRLVLQQVVTDPSDDAEQAYALRVAEGRIEVRRGRVAEPDVTFTQDRATAAAIARGELSAQAAFLAGRLRIGGQLHRFADAAAAMAELGDVFGAVRATTRW
ncbi:MAG: SCP2 sterol-binding domain-containing protein [Actinomycetota bacterium]